MSTERDIIIERLEQKLAVRDKEIEKMQELLRESIINEIEKRFSDKMKIRESTLDDIRIKFNDKVNEIIEMNKSLRDSVLEQRKSDTEALHEAEKRLDRLERRLVELNSSYDGVMKELLDQKSILQEFSTKKAKREEKPIQKETMPKEEAKPAEKPKPKGEYIIAENYIPKGKKKEQQVIEAEESTIVADDEPNEKEQFKRNQVKRSERLKEGVEIFEVPKKR